MKITENKIAFIHYTLTDDAGEVLDSSRESEPLAYLHGHGHLIPGLENELEGHEAGEKLKVSVAPEDGYGEIEKELIQVVPMDAFKGVDKVEAGMQFEAQTEEGGNQSITVIKVEGDNVTIDGNHPLAGMTLNFDVEITEVRDASAEELDHGHVHAPEGHHH